METKISLFVFFCLGVFITGVNMFLQGAFVLWLALAGGLFMSIFGTAAVKVAVWLTFK